jgi:hypothetical protein
MVAMDGAGAASHPFLAVPGTALEARFVAEENFVGRIGEEIHQFVGEVLAPDHPCFPVGRLGNAAGYFLGLAVLVEIAVEYAVSQIEQLLHAEVSTEFREGPMGLAGQGRIIRKREDDLGDNVGLELPAPAASGAVNEPVDAQLVKTRDPEAEGGFAQPAVAQGDVVSSADQEEMDRVEAAVGFAIRTAIERPLQLPEAAGARVR